MFKTWRYTLTGNGRLAVVLAAAAMAASAAVLVPQAASAATISDVEDDFLTTFAGPHNADLDVVSASAFFDSQNFFLSATMSGDIGETEGGLYVWGVDRGQGQELLNHAGNGQPAVGAGVRFDSVIRLTQDSKAQVFVLTPQGLKAFGEAFDATISGRTVSVKVSRSLLQSTGFDAADYGFNIWPRTGFSQNDEVSDFAPDNATFKAQAVPEPASWALMIAGFGALGATLRRRRALAA